VYYTFSRTQLYFTQQYSRDTTTCFGPICGPSSGCDLTSGVAIQDMWGVFWGLGEGGRDIVCFNSGYHGYSRYSHVIVSELTETWTSVNCMIISVDGDLVILTMPFCRA